MSSQQYRSTRSTQPETFSFEETVITGLASDGGLFLPSVIPQVSLETLKEWSNLSFQDLAHEIMKLYISNDEIPESDLKDLIQASYSTFRSTEITPLVPLIESKNLYLLELFHGPTFAFKDVALQFVGNLFEYFLKRKNSKLDENSKERHKITVVGATSGDTGSAAIYGLRGKKDVSVFILYPTNRISSIQELQMTSVLDANVHCLSVLGTFDDCQDIVKTLFRDKEFNDKYHIGAINSINWARILAQITYYFYSFFKLNKNLDINKKIKYVVPSGNFGDVLAGYFAKKMGLPIEKLVIATNENDILDRFMKTGKYQKESVGVKSTLSPAMDILISSNFERLLWYLIKDNLTNNNDLEAGKVLNDWMVSLKENNLIEAPSEVLKAALKDFDSERVSNEETLETIKEIYQVAEKYILDPHTSVGVTSSLRHIQKDEQNNEQKYYISLSTAHPAKFADAVNEALEENKGYNFDNDVLPEELKSLGKEGRRVTFVDDNSVSEVKKVIIEKLAEENKI
ncbi:threonine synthase THR4 [Ascoidea rubescens DSM 1968]|uniref:Threonine synthase n=1 Tax=Ascoidea rubescens DSM 1968 TaxID=1344418 RepID=A0A1D2VF04_9ASCO|nr:threonine synthase [Ascoidea rubescens DSM 1968]ODV60254.1 threonine synthase [Ascoidea rubescens DSM 1968]